MEKIFGPSYTGDPGVPHIGREAFTNWFLVSVVINFHDWLCPHFNRQLFEREYNWHDLAMVAENNKLKSAVRRQRRRGGVVSPEFRWNKLPARVRATYRDVAPDYCE